MLAGVKNKKWQQTAENMEGGQYVIEIKEDWSTPRMKCFQKEMAVLQM